MSDKYVFVHIPKTAGTSLQNLFTDTFSEENVSPAFPVISIDSDKARELDKYKVICGHISMNDVRRYFPNRKLITFLRDPIDRCLSVYGYFRQLHIETIIPLNQIQNVNSGLEAISLAKQLDINDFFNSIHPHILQNIQNRMTWQLGNSAKLEERKNCCDEELFNSAVDNLNNFSFVGLFENIGSDLRSICNVLGFSTSLQELTRKNVTSNPVRANQISLQTRQKIVSLNLLDTALYYYVTSKRTT